MSLSPELEKIIQERFDEISKSSHYSFKVTLDRDYIERELLDGEMTDDEWVELCEECDGLMLDEKNQIILQHTWVGDEYRNRTGCVMY